MRGTCEGHARYTPPRPSAQAWQRGQALGAPPPSFATRKRPCMRVGGLGLGRKLKLLLHQWRGWTGDTQLPSLPPQRPSAEPPFSPACAVLPRASPSAEHPLDVCRPSSLVLIASTAIPRTTTAHLPRRQTSTMHGYLSRGCDGWKVSCIFLPAQHLARRNWEEAPQPSGGAARKCPRCMNSIRVRQSVEQRSESSATTWLQMLM